MASNDTSAAAQDATTLYREASARSQEAARTFQEAGARWNSVSWLLIGGAALLCVLELGKGKLRF